MIVPKCTKMKSAKSSISLVILPIWARVFVSWPLSVLRERHTVHGVTDARERDRAEDRDISADGIRGDI